MGAAHPTEAFNTSAPRASSSALLVTSADGQVAQWAPHWLAQAGIAVTKIAAIDAYGHPALETPISIVLAESNTDLVACSRLADSLSAPLLVLCEASDQVARAIELGATDVACAPYNWQAIAHRAVRLTQSSTGALTQLDTALHALRGALRETEVARENLVQRTVDARRLGLLARPDMLRRIETALRNPDRSPNEPVLVVIGLNRFKQINEAYGYDFGNDVLMAVANRLVSLLKSEQLLGRICASSIDLTKLAGIRFAIHIQADAVPEELVEIAKQIMGSLSESFQIDGIETYVSPSIGVAVPPSSCTEANAEQLIQNAETAMLEAKHRGTGICLFRPSKLLPSRQRLNLEARLRHALERSEFVLEYQPLVEPDSGRIVAAEALLRWPAQEDYSTSEFVPVAEECGLMPELGEWIIDRACSDLQAWRARGCAPGRMAINLSLSQLLRGNVVDVVRHALQRYELDPVQLEFELSERGILSGDPQVLAQLEGLQELGVRLAIDDFGTGDTAIAYLKTLPVNAIKVDRSYIFGATQNEKDRALASGITTLAHALGMSVVAEGVESTDELELVKQWGCDEAQGFLFSRSLSAELFAELHASSS